MLAPTWTNWRSAAPTSQTLSKQNIVVNSLFWTLLCTEMTQSIAIKYDHTRHGIGPSLNMEIRKMKNILSTCAIAATVIAAPAFAQGYVGVGFGSSSASGFDQGLIAGGNASKASVKIYGGFQFTPMLGLEAQYSD